jgi:hypothetical protein
MRLRAGVIVATAVLASACGGSSPTPKAQVAAYVKKVNALERRLQAPLQAVKQTVASVLPQSGASARQQKLTGAWRQIVSVRASLAALRAPPAAMRLRVLLLRVADKQADLTLQQARLAGFVPAFSAAVKPLAPATIRLQGVLRSNQTPGTAAVATLYARKADALRSFRAVASQLLGRLLRLTAPRLLEPSYRAELQALRGMARAAGQLAVALSAGQTNRIAPLLGAFDAAAAAPGTTAAQRARRAAVVAYDRQVAEVSQIELDAARERLRLANSLR